ncbi:polygalacturonase inhibitor-like isoform X2 [Andrographis paniculata]|uniref:polygalacturonase inhibitor-like isoform X2 n=1 Tax=Andrographis paniculata TaxID=175694 RepID=UPI0021E74438|nr:polygalacturonase inhibitor-like isoform X2 [Andrographis paniculata]
MPFQTVFFLLLLHSLSPPSAADSSSSSGLCHPDDQSALLQFKNSFSDPKPFPTWDPKFHCCGWYGVECNETTNHVIGLDIATSDLNGTIPITLPNLKHLQHLRLHKLPNLVGEIPPEIGQLHHLTYLVISWTNVSGPVPHFLSNLISLSRNHLTGPIPESFGHFPESAGPPALDLSHNMLSGDIPASLANVNFSEIDISRNSLSGDASVFFGLGKITNTIIISRNNFEFDFSKVTFMEDLDVLDISHNKIYGTIPSQIIDAVYLQQLNVSYNRLCGKIPTGWKLRYRSEIWDNSSFLHNRCLCGFPLDPCQ